MTEPVYDLESVEDQDDNKDEAFLVRNEDGSTTLTLEFPFSVTVGGQSTRYEALTLKRLTVAAIRRASGKGDAVTQGLALLGASAGLMPVIIDRLDGADFSRASRVVSSFLSGGRRIGRTS